MARKKKKTAKSEGERANRAEKRAIKSSAELKAMKKLIEKGWRPKD